MAAGTEVKSVLPDSGTSPGEYVLGDQPRMFKKHKVLPRPKREAYPGAGIRDLQRSTPRIYGLEVDTLVSRSSSLQDSSPSLRRQSRRVTSGPEPPPTPPAHSRKSSSSRSVNNTSSPTYVASPLQSSENVQSRDPTTPTNQQTPPTPNLTPERTPPGPVTRHAKPRPLVSDRIPSKLTVDSRTESFRTAPENPLSSEDEDDGRSTLRALPPSAKTSQSTVRQINGDKQSAPRAVGLGLGLESSPGGEITPRTAKEFNVFDGEWANGGASGSEVEQEWDDNLERNVTVKKRRPVAPVNGHKEEVIEELQVTPTNATKALRSMSLQESPIVYPSRRVVSDRFPIIQTAPSHSESSISSDFKRSSIMSTKSTASTIVEAILVENAPQRRKTLRHVRKQMGLRDSRSDLSPTSSAATSISTHVDKPPQTRPSNPKIAEMQRDGRREPRREVQRETPRESVMSNGTVNTISSHKARREVRRNGGIPVVIVPERKSSVKSNSREPSLRSTSSRRSKRSQSLTSAQVSQVSRSRDPATLSEKPARRSRAMSESDGSRPGDQRTMDFPPTIPTRSSSLSAPTSRNASRTGSLTAESLRAHNAFQAQQGLQGVNLVLEKLDMKRPKPEQGDTAVKKDEATRSIPITQPSVQADMLRPEILIRRATSLGSRKSEEARHSTTYPESHDTHDDEHRLHVDRYGDPFFGKRLSVQNTPFSQASVDTTGTSHAEVSEALAVNIYPHQNKSVLVVDHSNKPSESSSLEQHRFLESWTPRVRTSDAEEKIPVTPPQAMSMDNVDSPLRNPRAPPEPPSMPPAINFIPATPSGLTPSVEKQKQLGNFYDLEEKPKRRPSLLQRTLSRGRSHRDSEYGPSPARPVGLLKRTFSLSRNSRKSDWDDGDRPGLRRHSFTDDAPADENRLHPHWRPAYADDSMSESEDDWAEEETSGGRTYRFPRIDNRPWQPRRSLSARMKRTFAILPVRDDYEYEARDADRRTIRRTPSGNLRVMKFRKSLESMPRLPINDGRPYTAPGDGALRARQFRFWRSPKSSADSFRRSGLLPALERINIPRRMSERRRERRTQELRRMISSPREVRDGVGDVIRRNSYREAFEQQPRHV